ncbi:hypothetical protein FHR83_003119 [Actinoplanes campanulatus]|uniref:Resolvase/invertase-type recombinase catalytic domain-containing protein n=1 Tax=Actinoplanes campanulatus TaxID=113559 RepID=A0A7W5AGB8_9ACTN|nr:hypothetical protein [Actinoplanes campanulatus]GGN09073.1 hypothetical protein GCM10010109_18160 [Actinoplanes campanulatus]GID36334.1 hypothetical protein Aca09nite_28400 [Actinoplanes campanulatus]
MAQAIGRWGNYFNQELFGGPHRALGAAQQCRNRPTETHDIALYHPTLLYESLWCVGVFLLLIWAEKRFRLTGGRVVALYIAAYTLGRAWVESLRVDDVNRLARSLQDLITLTVELRRRGIGFKSLHEALDTTTPGGRLVFQVFAALAEFIRELIIENARDGVTAAKARGHCLGRPRR